MASFSCACSEEADEAQRRGAAHRAPRLFEEAGPRPGTTTAPCSQRQRIAGCRRGIWHVSTLTAVLGIVLGLCSTSNGDVAAFVPPAAVSSALLRLVGSKGLSFPHGLKAQVPGHIWTPPFGDMLGRSAAFDRCRTALSASTFSGGRTTGEDDFHYPEGTTQFVAECDLPTERGNFRLRAYSYRGAKVVVRDGEHVLEWTEMEPVIIYKGNLRGSKNAVVRVHDQCYTSEVLGSKRCDCREQLELALDYINQHGGALVYMPQEGRGIGLANKIAAYQLQDGGLDTVDANRALGFGDDERSYACVPFMLSDMGIKAIRLMTNNPMKIRQLTELGVKIIGAKSHVVASNEFNAKYLRTKAARMAHALPELDTDAASGLQDSAAVTPAAAVAAVDVRWRFGKKSVEAAAKAMAAGSAVVMVDGSRHNEGWLVASAAGISTGTLGLLNQLGDGVSVAVAGETVAEVEVHWPQCSAAYLDKHEALAGEASAGRGVMLQGRVALLRRLAAISAAASAAKAAAIVQQLPPPLAALLEENDSPTPGDSPTLGGMNSNDSDALDTGADTHSWRWEEAEEECMRQRLMPLRSKIGALMTAARSSHDAVVELAKLARAAPVGVMSPILDAERLDSMSFAQLLEMSKVRGLVVTSVEDIVCYRAGNFEVPSLFESRSSI